MDECRWILERLGLIGKYLDFPMFDSRGHLVYWYKVEREGYFAIGEATTNVDGKWRGYIIPEDAEPKPILRLPSLMEAPY